MPKFDQDGNPVTEPPPETRFMVGSINAKFLHGKSTKPIMSLTLDGAVQASIYLSQLDYGKFVIFELVPVTVEANGDLTRQT